MSFEKALCLVSNQHGPGGVAQVGRRGSGYKQVMQWHRPAPGTVFSAHPSFWIPGAEG